MKLLLLCWLRVKHLIFIFREKGLRYTFNYVYFHMLYGTKNPFLINLLYWLESYPSFIEVEVTTRCNLKCVFCEHTYWHEPNKDMSFEQFKYIVDQFPKLKWIGLTGIGESLLNSDFISMLKYVKSKNILVELYDTFYFIDKNIDRDLIELKIDKIFVSMDAATKETYEKIRVGSCFERVVNNVKNFIVLRKEKKVYFPELAFHYIISRENFKEIPQYIELVHSLAMGEKVTIQFTRMLHNFKEVDNLFIEIPKDIIVSAKEKARTLGMKITWNADTSSIKPVMSKCTEWIMPFIFVTGHVIPCCSGNEAGCRDFQRQTAMGNIFEQSFKEIWYGEKYKALRKNLHRGKPLLSCKECCLYTSK